MQATGVDAHCHLDLYPNFSELIKRVEEARVYTITMTTTPKAWQRNKDLTSGLRYVRPALGLHPQLVGERSFELSEWMELLPEARYIGEVGLDAGPKFFRSLDRQEFIFHTILKACSEIGGKVISIHSIRSGAKVLDALEKHLSPNRCVPILHWFTGTTKLVRRAADLGCYFSVNHCMANNDRGINLLREIPADRLITETDGPFTEIDGSPTDPRALPAVIKKVASAIGMGADSLHSLTLKNFKAMLAATDGVPSPGNKEAP